MSFDVKYFQNETLSSVSRVEENLIAVAYFFVKYHPLNKQFSNFIVFQNEKKITFFLSSCEAL